MTQTQFELCLGRLLTDAAFRLDFFSRPESTLALHALELNEAELRALERIPVSTLLDLASHLDVEVLRLSVPDEIGSPLEHRRRA